MHLRMQFIIYELDLFEHKAYARPTEVNYHTRPRDLTDVTMINAVRTAGIIVADILTVFIGDRFRLKFWGEDVILAPFVLHA